MNLPGLSTAFAVSLYLRHTSGCWSTEASLRTKFDLSTSRLAELIEKLEQMGYPVVGPTALGYRLEGQCPLLGQEIAFQLGTRLVGKTIETHEQVSSTNDLARARALDGADAGTVIFADYQCSGRGRFGRTWSSPRGKNLLFSVILYPPTPAPSSSLLAIAAAVAIAQALRNEFGMEARIRWPNDVVLQDKKLAGILVEPVSTLRRQLVWVLGTGLNVNASPPGVPSATSISQELARPVDRVLLARAILREMDGWYQRIASGENDEISERWRQFSTTLGKRVTLERKGEHFSGRVVHISASKGVTLQLDDGLFATFAGEQVALVD